MAGSTAGHFIMKEAYPGYNPHAPHREIFFKCTGHVPDPTSEHIIGGLGAYIDVEKMVIIHNNKETDIRPYKKISSYSIEKKQFVFGDKEF